jgi:site-specific DNA-methyltransferase (adenine-specific)
LYILNDEIPFKGYVMKNIVYNMDCLEFMKNCKDNQFDLAICDPPYGINYANNFDTRLCDPIMKRLSPIKRGFYKKCDWDASIPKKKYFDELFRVSKNQIIWGGNYFIEYLYNSKGIIVWDKENKLPTYADGEIAWSSFNKPLKIFYFLWDGFKQAQYPGRSSPVQGNHKIKEKRIHPTQKPIALYKWLLQNYAKPGQTIFDSHVGSGSIRCACYELGFDFVGCELDKDCWKAQEKRFEAFKAKVDNKFYIPDEEQTLFN